MSSDVLGIAHLANDTMLKRQVVMRHIECPEDNKSSDKSWRDEFAQYAGKLGAMQHPNMLTIYDLSCEDDCAYVISQYLEGETLAERLKAGAMSQVSVYSIASDLLEVLHAAHESEVFHGGLHTGSIIRIDRASGGYRSLLMDLGLARLVSIVKGERVKVIDPVLMAPELFEEGSKADAKADLFMLGQICYTALIGGHPFSGKSEQECVEAYKNGEIPPLVSYLENIDPAFAEWIMRMGEVNPEERFEDSAAAMVALHEIQLSDPEPNVAGISDMVYEQQTLTEVAGPQVLAADQVASVQSSVVATGGTIQSIANLQNMQGALEQKEGKTMMYVIGGLAALLILVLTLVVFGGGA